MCLVNLSLACVVRVCACVCFFFLCGNSDVRRKRTNARKRGKRRRRRGSKAGRGVDETGSAGRVTSYFGFILLLGGA